MYGIWERLVPPRWRQSFFSKSLLEWFFVNLGENGDVEGRQWSTLFAMVTWWGWKWCCGNVFGTNGKCRDRVKFLKDLAEEVTKAYLATEDGNRQMGRVERLIAWTPPREGWLKLNTDGESKGNPGLASAGGVLRDAEGRWCGGFCGKPWDLFSPVSGAMGSLLWFVHGMGISGDTSGA
ncbi:hypothetical protein ISN44_As12g040050 [Arabidopsis suecica]|uniref:RNase H type-1 domain-containing protein n=1 Tax=Arabidopsis suecica TaxID=45249 RepID=A0A8T1YRI0_ARASU|nr:hypothetical protein ISN44_As12g040050 [Arabidopsis suecica]